MSTWIDVDVFPTRHRKVFCVDEFDLEDIWHMRLAKGIDAGTFASALFNRLIAAGFVPEGALLRAFGFQMDAAVFKLYVMHETFEEVKPGELAIEERVDLRRWKNPPILASTSVRADKALFRKGRRIRCFRTGKVGRLLVDVPSLTNELDSYACEFEDGVESLHDFEIELVPKEEQK